MKTQIYESVGKTWSTAVILMFVVVCCDSSLSDVPVSDPSLFQMQFLVQRSSTATSTTHYIGTTIYDKNLACVELKDGKVKVNGQEMTKATALFNCPYYEVNNATTALATVYQFEAVLADGHSYGGSVTTQSQAFAELTLPASINAQTDAVISWSPAYAHEELSVVLKFKVANSSVPTLGPSLALTQSQITTGTFTIPKTNFSTPANITEVEVSLVGTVTGTVDSKFRTGSAAKSKMIITRSVPFH